MNCPFEITLDKEFEFYETKTDNLNIYPNGIISFDSTLQEFYNSLQNNDDGDTFATIVVPYYKGKSELQADTNVWTGSGGPFSVSAIRYSTHNLFSQS